jgi:YVTN family beta-propeller protein
MAAVLAAGLAAAWYPVVRPDAVPGAGSAPARAASPSPAAVDLLPGMPPPLLPDEVYAAAGPGALSAAVRGDRELVYVPRSTADDVAVIDPHTFRVLDRYPAGRTPQHVVASYDLRTLYVAADRAPGGSLTTIDPRTGRPGRGFAVDDPYNLYFTPDGRSAVVVAEAQRRLDFYDPRTWRLQQRLRLATCAGVNHMDFTADGRHALVSCGLADRLVVLDVAARRQVREFTLPVTPSGTPRDVRLSPDGRTFFVADPVAGGIYHVDGQATRLTAFTRTGAGANGLAFSRDATRLYVANRDAGTVSVLDANTARPDAVWTIPGGSPEAGSPSADGDTLWLSGRDGAVYVLRTTDGALLARIPVGGGPGGPTYWPQPGRYSLGHTSTTR